MARERSEDSDQPTPWPLGNTGRPGAEVIFPFKDDLVGYMRDRRTKEKYLRVFHLILWIKRNHRPWLLQYIESKKTFASGYESETGVYFDMPPGKTLAEVEKSSKVDKKNKHSERISVVLTVRADGMKLPLLFIIKGQPGGLLEKTDPTHVYAVQANAWMDERVWNIYLERLFAQHVQDASVLLVDNLECHVSKASYDKTAEAMFSVIEPIPQTQRGGVSRSMSVLWARSRLC
ncbi:hypothetical protein DYB31_006376 [Aphanomyces astaci]|uniref:DDE-1 domain-containing protein n=1 Tax=Aphanomyces astaci TaxID=112090 RepID=A0A397EXY2_APHAT|nr:hypothetical protein DYB31_006376 [Aphanomyces astaci]